MNDCYILQVGAFVDFLNGKFENDLKNTAEAHFRVEDLRPRFLFGVERQKIVLDNMYSPSVAGFYGNNIKRVADVLHSKRKTKHFSLVDFKAENWETMQINVVKPIELRPSKIIEPQILTLHYVSTREDNITYLEQLRRPEQLTYENSAWRFAE